MSAKVACMIEKNIFHAFQSFYRFAYTHNPPAYVLLNQFSPDIDDLLPWTALYLQGDLWINSLFRGDADMATISWSRIIKQLQGYTYSLFLSRLYNDIKRENRKCVIVTQFRWAPNHDHYTNYTLEQATDYLVKRIETAQVPFLSYYHFFPPHDPYNTRSDFFGRFANDGYLPVRKPDHLFRGNKAEYWIDFNRIAYDEFMLYVDAEFDRLYTTSSKLASWIIRG
jgi:hypothetical protein